MFLCNLISILLVFTLSSFLCFRLWARAVSWPQGDECTSIYITVQYHLYYKLERRIKSIIANPKEDIGYQAETQTISKESRVQMYRNCLQPILWFSPFYTFLIYLRFCLPTLCCKIWKMIKWVHFKGWVNLAVTVSIPHKLLKVSLYSFVSHCCHIQVVPIVP